MTRRRQRGFTATEFITAIAIVALVCVAAASLLIDATQGLANANASTKITNRNAQGLRRMSEELRKAMSITISDYGRRIDYVHPKLATSADPATGEKEYVDPLTGDGVVRYFKVDFTAGTVTDGVTNRIIARNVVSKDPDTSSSQYGQVYEPFQATSIGSAKAVTITLITQEQIGTEKRHVRLKTTAQLRNYK